MASEFDVAVAVMSFEHQPDLGAAFRKVRGLLVPGGEFYLVFGDARFHLTPRFDVEIEAIELEDGSTVVATRRPYGILHDLIRPAGHYTSAARAAGFVVRRERELVPTAELFDADPRWRELEGRAVARLLVSENED